MSHDIVDKFSTHLKNVLTRALCFVVEQDEKTIQPEHLLWALGTQKGCIAAEILKKSGVKAVDLKKLVGAHVETRVLSDAGGLTLQLSDDAKRIVEKAVLTANVYGHRYVGTEHLLSGILQVNPQITETFFGELQINLKDLKSQLTVVLKSTSKFPDLTGGAGTGPGKMVSTQPEKKEESASALQFFALELTSPQAQKKLDPVIGRNQELERVMEILCRRTKNNPLLLGEPGVGKTALVEGLAKRIYEGKVPAMLTNKRLISLDISGIVAGTIYRGEFENRLKQIIEEIQENPDILLFIDEIHMIVGAGAASGSLDAAQILKPALARGEIHCIGATTPGEFKKHIETDAALERRFQTVVIEEPSAEDTLHILQGIAPSYTSFHQVQFTDTALQAAVRLSGRYLSDKRFPDKAIDLIDEAAASVRVRTQHPSQNDRMRAAHRELERIREQKREAVRTENFTQALSLKKQEQHLQETCKQWEQASPPSELLTVDEQQIIEIVSRLTH